MKELNQIKARCEAAKSVPVHCKRCKWFADLPKCVAEIERLKDMLTTITTKHNLLMSVSVYGPCKCKGSVLCMKHAAEEILKMIKEFDP